MRLALFFAIFALGGCGAVEVPTIPLGQTTGFRDGYLVKVTRGGGIAWNGQKLNEDQFAKYLQEYAALPKDAGRLWVEFGPGVSAEQAASVRERIILSGLCQQKRCVEGRWGVPRPVVH